MKEDDQAEVLVARFSECLKPLGVQVHHVGSSSSAGPVIGRIAKDTGVDSAVYSSELFRMAPDSVSALAGSGVDVHISEGAIAVRDAPLGITTARQAIAETGSLLVSEETLDDRSVALLSLACVSVVPTTALVPSLTDSVDVLRALAMRPHGNYASFVTGPSRTADIELSLTLGVQGPARIEIVFVDNLT